MELTEWVLARERAALGRVRLTGMGLALVLCAVAGWLGIRQMRLSALPQATSQAVMAQSVAQAHLRLKSLALTAYLAKVRGNSLLMDVTGKPDVESPCVGLSDLRGLPDSSPCAALWLQSLRRIWAAAIGPAAPPIPEHLLRDPWGAPYLLNQSEESCGHFGAWCPPDAIRSAGPDGKPDTPDDITEAIPQLLGPKRVR